MSILDKHPAPWRCDCGGIYDSNDAPVGYFTDGSGLLGLILAAPELLEVLKELVELSPPFGRKFIVKVNGQRVERDDPAFKAAKLISRIEGGDPVAKGIAHYEGLGAEEKAKVIAAMEAEIKESMERVRRENNLLMAKLLEGGE